MADGEGLERRRHQDAALNLGLDVEVVGDHYVVDDGLQDLVDFTFRSEQADLLQAIDHIDLGLAFPGALGLDGACVMRLLTLILYGLRSVYGDVGEFGTAPEGLQGVDP